MSRYARAKENARQKAIEWQLDFNNHNYSYGELAYFTEYFTKLAKWYGLTEEFRENGIIGKNQASARVRQAEEVDG